MAEQGGGFGPAEPVTTPTAPFSVTGPTAMSLDGARTGTASFVVTNVSGRPLRARLLPQPLSGADASWLSVVGDMERPLGVAATLTAEVRVTVPDAAPAGEHALRLDVAAEDRPDQVTAGQAVSFSVPAPQKKSFPRWLLILIVVAVLVLAVGGFLIWRAVSADPPPTPTTPPTLSGAATVGETLTVTPGTWDEAVELVHVWQSCPGDAADDDPAGCVDVTVEVDGTTTTATGTSLVVGADQEGRRLRVVERAIPSADIDDEGEVDEEQIPGQASALTAAVAPAPQPTAEVPNVVGLRQSQANDLLTARGLVTVVTRIGSTEECDPVVSAQSSPVGTNLPVGSAVGLVTPEPPPFFICRGLVLDGPIFQELPFEFEEKLLRELTINP